MTIKRIALQGVGLLYAHNLERNKKTMIEPKTLKNANIRSLLYLTLLCGLALLSGCGGAGVTTNAAPALSAVSITLTPQSMSIPTGTTQAFTATVNNSEVTSVSWQVNGITGGNTTFGTIDKNGNYTAPLYTPLPSNVIVSAFATVDNTASASAAVTITGNPPPVTVTLTPSTTSVFEGATAQFNAVVSDSSNTITDFTVTWEVNGIVGGNDTVGTITTSGSGNAIYTSPLQIPNPPTVTVSAISNALPTIMATATVTINGPPVSVQVSPSSALMNPSTMQQFVATVSGSTDTSVVWQVNGVTGGNSTVGTVSTSGLYTAPSVVPNPATVNVTAVSNANPADSGTAAVTITNVIQPIVVTVTPTVATVQVSTTFNFAASVSNSLDTSVTWSMSGQSCTGSTCGAVTNGTNTTTYTAPATAPNPTNVVTVTATSNADPTKSASAVVTVTSASAIVVSVTPGQATLQVDDTQQFHASLAGTTDQAVTWELSGGQGVDPNTIGTIDVNGIYTAPATVPVPDPNVTVTARSVADTTKTGSAIVTVIPAPVITVSLDPSSVNIEATTGQNFTATVTGALNPTVTNWSVNGILGGDITTVGSITDNGDGKTAQYTAPATVPNPATVNVTAAAVDDTTKLGTASVTITPFLVISVQVSPTAATVAPGQTQQFNATVNGTSDQVVVWTLTGSGCTADACGTLDQTGLYTAPLIIPMPNTVTVTATSHADPTQNASATITIAAATLGITISPPGPYTVQAGSTAVLSLTTTITAAPPDSPITWSMGCISLSDDSDWCHDTDFDNSGPGTFVFNGTTVKRNGSASGTGDETMTYTAPGTVGFTNFQVNSCEPTTNTGVAQVPLTATITFNGNTATALACVTVTQ